MNKIIILLLIGMALILMQACGSSAKEADLPVRKSCNLERLYKDMLTKCQTLCEKEQRKGMDENKIKMFFDSKNN